MDCVICPLHIGDNLYYTDKNRAVTAIAEMKYTIKDSVFTYLFRQPEYTLQLYRTLHPEDTTTTETDLEIITLENVLTTGQYNDLGIQLRDTLMLLTEAQSKWSLNVSLRMAFYLSDTYNRYIITNEMDLYSTRAVQIPRPELYVVYTGNKKNIPDAIHLSDLYSSSGPIGMEVTVKVLQDSGANSILDQYVCFCKIANEQRILYKDDKEKAILETIRICKEQGILAAFLQEREKEVQEIMTTLFNEAWIGKMHEKSILMEGIEKGKTERDIEIACNALKRNMSIDDIVQWTGLSRETVEKLSV